MMKKRNLIILTLLIFLMIPQIAKACWVYLTVDELVEMSDIIIIGEVSDRLGSSIKTEHVNYNKWKVKVHYYVKGDMNDSEIVVGTPDERTSLHYDLNAQGNQVLLFLRKDESYYLPHSPQAVVGVTFVEDNLEVEEKISGKDLQKLIQITDENMDAKEKEKLEEYLSTMDLIQVVGQVTEVNGGQEVLIGLMLIGALVSGLLVARKK